MNSNLCKLIDAQNRLSRLMVEDEPVPGRSAGMHISSPAAGSSLPPAGLLDHAAASRESDGKPGVHRSPGASERASSLPLPPASGAISTARVPFSLTDAVALTTTQDREVRRLAWVAVAAIAALAAAAGLGKEAAMRSLPVLRPVVAAASSCFDLNCAGVQPLSKCILCCAKYCNVSTPEQEACENACLSQPTTRVAGMAEIADDLKLAGGDDAVRLAGLLAWNAQNNNDLRVRAFALALATEHPLSSAMLENRR